MTTQRRVIFVCTGNYYRSRYAEHYFNTRVPGHGGWRAESRGFLICPGNVGPIAPVVVNRLNRLGIAPADLTRPPRLLRPKELTQADRVVVMDEKEHRPYVERQLPAWRGRVTYWCIADVTSMPPEEAFLLMEAKVDALVRQLQEQDPVCPGREDRTLSSQTITVPSGVVCRVEQVADSDAIRAVPWLEIPLMARSPAIDGVLDPGEWQEAVEVEGFIMPVSGVPARPVTKCRLGLDGLNLYLAFDCQTAPGLEVGLEGDTRAADVVTEDKVDFFICPDDVSPRYCMFVVSSTGSRKAKRVSFDAQGRPGTHDDQWRPRWDAQVGKREDGWTVEAAVPWAELGMLPEGARGIRLNCCRSVMADGVRRQVHSSWAFLPTADFHRPERFGVGLCRFDRQAPELLRLADLHLHTLGLLNAQRCSPIFPVPGRFEAVCVGGFPQRALLRGTDAVELTVEAVPVDADGEAGTPSALGRFSLVPRKSARLTVDGPTKGDYLLNLHFRSGGVTQTCSLPVMAETLSGIERRLRDIRSVAEQSPFRAVAYLGVAACVDRLRRQVATGCPADDVMMSIREAKTRLDVLGGGKATVVDDSLLGLLNLARDPEAQVVVEYLHSQRKACVTFCCGAIPLVSVDVTECGSPEEATAMLPGFLERHKRSPMLDSGSEATTIAGRPARISAKIYDAWSHRPMTSPFNAVDQVLLVDVGTMSAMALDVKYLDCAKVDAVVILPECPPLVRSVVDAWAKGNGNPVVGTDEAIEHRHVMVTGDLRSVADRLSFSELSAVYPMSERVNGTVSTAVVSGKRLYAVWHASRSIAAKALRMVMVGQPITPSDVDGLRMDIVRHCAPKTESKAVPQGLRPFCGDVHMHTCFSHGEDEASPVGLALESLYCFMDFISITDHDSIDGAQLGRNMFASHRVDYTLMVGEEIGAGCSHLNAYPLKEVIRASSQAEAVGAARGQGALIQWNHPDSDVAQMKAMVGDGFDAWEHYPRQYYDEWRKAGTLPTLIGSSDTHDGTFGFFAFGYFERTLVLAPSCREKDIVEAIRRERVVLVTPAGGGFFYGPAAMVGAAWAALADGQGLKAAKADHLRRVLCKADLMGLITDNNPLQGKASP